MKNPADAGNLLLSCYTTNNLTGASDGNRTRILTLARLRSTTELHLQFATGFPNRVDYYSKIKERCNIISN